MLYALAHDAITWSIAPSYFVIGKGLPDAATSFAPVARMAALAGWSAGLGVGLVLVVANHPRSDHRQLSYRELARELASIAAVAAFVALSGALVGPIVGEPYAELLRAAGVGDGRSYLAVQAAHVGTYVGVVIGAGRAWRRVRRLREGAERDRHPAGQNASVAPSSASQ